MPAPQTQTIFVLQSFPVGHTVWPSEAGQATPRNFTQAQMTLTGDTAVPLAATVEVDIWLSFDNAVTWHPAGGLFITGSGASPAGDSITVPFEGATQYKVTVDVTGSPVTLGASVTLT